MKKSAKTKKHTPFSGKATAAIVVGALILLFGLTTLAGAGGLIWFSAWAEKAEVDASKLPTAAALPTFLDRNGKEIPYVSDSYLTAEEIPQNVKSAFVALEDKRFYSHDGVDKLRLAGAAVNNLKAGAPVEGASTITQQLVKNTHLTSAKTLDRKLNEMAIARKLERKYSKDEILAMYLSVIYFGNGCYGVKEASEKYFGKKIDSLSVAECATLAGIVKNPARFSPVKHAEEAEKRRNLVLSVMEKEGYITAEEKVSALSEDMTARTGTERNSNADFYIGNVISEVTALLGITEYQLNNSGLTVMTNLDPEIQAMLAAAAENSSNFENPGVDSETVIMENGTGKVLAHQSSLGYSVSRQAGSTLKPLVVYAPALEENAVNLASPILDEPTDFGGWTPKNYKGIYYGATNPREAIKKSMNVAAVKVAEYVGTGKMLSYGRKFGLSLADGDASLPLALGVTEKGTTPLSLAAGYSALANGGKYISPHYVYAVLEDGKKIYQAAAAETVAVSEDTAYLTTSCLVDTAKSGTAESLSVLPFEVAAKTGTVGAETNTDAWCASYTSGHTAVVWHGANSMSETGGGRPTKHAKEILSALYEDALPENFTRPNGIVEYEVDVMSTNLNKQTTLSVELTPDKYRKKELFRASNAVDFGKSLYESTNVKFSAAVRNKRFVDLELTVSELYRYRITAWDVFGERRVADLDGAEYLKDKASAEYKEKDRPVTIGAPVVYEACAYVVGKDGKEYVLGEKTVRVYFGKQP